MKRLLLLRHAKAVPGDAKTGDAERKLDERGREDAPRVGAVMQHRRYVPDVVLCSSSRRTIETWQGLAPELETSPEPAFLDSLYLASAKSIMKIVRSTDGRASVVLVIGHNPGLWECARTLSRISVTPDEDARRAALESKFPTCALAVLDFEPMHWNALAPREAALIDFVRPKELRQA